LLSEKILLRFGAQKSIFSRGLPGRVFDFILRKRRKSQFAQTPRQPLLFVGGVIGIPIELSLFCSMAASEK